MKPSEKYQAARNRVKMIRGFYYHLAIYIIVNIVILAFRTPIVLFFTDVGEPTGDGFLEWVDLNIILTPLLWGVSLFIHYAVVFGLKPKFIKDWEERKLKKFLQEEEDPAQKWM